MSNAIVTFDSTHQAMAAEDLLRGQGVEFEVVPPPSNLSAGCGLALRIGLEDARLVMNLLHDRGASYAAVHLLDEQQTATEKLG